MSLGINDPPQPLEEGLQVMKFTQCLNIVIVIGNYTDKFQGEGIF